MLIIKITLASHNCKHRAHILSFAIAVNLSLSKSKNPKLESRQSLNHTPHLWGDHIIITPKIKITILLVSTVARNFNRGSCGYMHDVTMT